MISNNVEITELNFKNFVAGFHAKVQQVLRIKQQMAKKRWALFSKAKNDPRFIYSDLFVNELRNITTRERRLHRICEAGLEKARLYLANIESNLKNNEGDKQTTKIVRSHLAVLGGVIRHIMKRLSKLDRRLAHEERFLEVRDKKHLVAFLKEYKKELLEDQRLRRELESGAVDIGRLENTLGYSLKRAGIKVGAVAALPLTVPATIPLKIGELLLRPLTCLFADIVLSFLGFDSYPGSTMDDIEAMKLSERLAMEVKSTIDLWLAMVEELIYIVKESELPGISQSSLFYKFKLR